MTPRQNMLAVGLEAIPGTLLFTFGIGHLYAGRVVAGLSIMFAYWVLQGINLALMPLGIGWITAPLTWLAFTVLSSTDVIAEEKLRLPVIDRG